MEQAAEGSSRTAGVPPERVGAALADQRRRRGLTRRAAAERAGLNARRLKAYELGRARVPDDDLERLAAAYELPATALLPTRSTVRFDTERSTLRVGDRVRRVDDIDSGSFGVLKEYLELVYELRNTSRLERIPLRDDDLDALARAFGPDSETIEQRLMDLMDITHDEAVAMRRVILRRRLAMPAAGLMMGAGVLTGFEWGNPAAAEGRVEAVVVDGASTSATEPIVASGPLPTDGGADPALQPAGTDEPPAPEPPPAPEESPEPPAQDVDIGTAIVQEYGDPGPTVRGDDEPAPDDEQLGDVEIGDVEIGTAIVQEYGDEGPTVRE